MKTLLLLIILFTAAYESSAQDSSYTLRRDIPVKIIYVPDKLHYPADTVSSRAIVRIDHESKADAAKKMADTTYLDQLAGTYLRSNDHRFEIKLWRRDKTLFLSIPGYSDYELVPELSLYFTAKDNPDLRVLIYISPDNVVQGINIQTKKENYAASRKSE